MAADYYEGYGFKALQVALQALEEIAAHYPADWEFDICVYAKNLLYEALAEPARKPLTDAEISAIVQSMSAHTWDAHMLARAIERAHGIGSD